MNHFFHACFLLCLATFGQLSALDEPINRGTNLESLYKKHLPSGIFEYVIKHNLLDVMDYETITNKQNLDSLDTLTITLEIDKVFNSDYQNSYLSKALAENSTVVSITFYAGTPNIKENFGGISMTYYSGKAIACALFDAEGLDYLCPLWEEPFPDEGEEIAATTLLLLMEGGLEKLKFLEQIEKDS